MTALLITAAYGAHALTDDIRTYRTARKHQP